jgi:hypothetical protein
MALQLTALVENNALSVEFALRNPLDVDVYVDQFEVTRAWPPELRGYVYVHRGNGCSSCTSARSQTRPAFV